MWAKGMCESEWRWTRSRVITQLQTLLVLHPPPTPCTRTANPQGSAILHMLLKHPESWNKNHKSHLQSFDLIRSWMFILTLLKSAILIVDNSGVEYSFKKRGNYGLKIFATLFPLIKTGSKTKTQTTSPPPSKIKMYFDMTRQWISRHLFHQKIYFYHSTPFENQIFEENRSAVEKPGLCWEMLCSKSTLLTHKSSRNLPNKSHQLSRKENYKIPIMNKNIWDERARC